MTREEGLAKLDMEILKQTLHDLRLEQQRVGYDVEAVEKVIKAKVHATRVGDCPMPPSFADLDTWRNAYYSLVRRTESQEKQLRKAEEAAMRDAQINERLSSDVNKYKAQRDSLEREVNNLKMANQKLLAQNEHDVARLAYWKNSYDDLTFKIKDVDDATANDIMPL